MTWQVRTTRKAITLIELLIVASLLAVVCSTSGFFIYRAVAREQYQANVASLLEAIYFAKDLAVQIDSEVNLTLRQSDEGLLFSLEADKPLSTGIGILKNSRDPLKRIQAMIFNRMKLDELQLHFSRMGMIQPYGIVAFQSSFERPESTLAIELSPFPSVIKLQTSQFVPNVDRMEPVPKEVENELSL